MSLLQNFTLSAQYPLRLAGATATNTQSGYMRSRHGIRGETQATRFMLFPQTSAFPWGYTQNAIFQPLKVQEMASFREAFIGINVAGAGALGYGIAGNGGLAVDVHGALMAIVWANGAARIALNAGAIATALAHLTATGSIAVDASLTSYALGKMAASGRISLAAEALGQLVISGEGAALIGIGADGEMAAVIAGEGAARIAIGASGDLVGALFGTAGARITIDAEAALAAIGELAAAGLIAVGADLVPYALGEMAGSTTGGGDTLTTSSIASAVWSAAAGANDSPGSMGEKLNDSGSASNPWTEVIESGYTAAEILRVLAAVAAGRSEKDGSTLTFRDLGDTKDRVSGTVSNGERTAVTLEVG